MALWPLNGAMSGVDYPEYPLIMSDTLLRMESSASQTSLMTSDRPSYRMPPPDGSRSLHAAGVGHVAPRPQIPPGYPSHPSPPQEPYPSSDLPRSFAFTQSHHKSPQRSFGHFAKLAAFAAKVVKEEEARMKGVYGEGGGGGGGAVQRAPDTMLGTGSYSESEMLHDANFDVGPIDGSLLPPASTAPSFDLFDGDSSLPEYGMGGHQDLPLSPPPFSDAGSSGYLPPLPARTSSTAANTHLSPGTYVHATQHQTPESTGPCYER